mmetsp:Transcript_76463/g.151294  ORF Transcript_76463/g.151294 Transcript_76463/m.151294 type:complete len:94 (-) Transcript_76463:376-657(-)
MDNAKNKLGQRGYKGDNACKASVDHQKEEKFVILEADAVVDPSTVVVHSQHANLAGGAVVCPFWTRDSTTLAKCSLTRLPLWPGVSNRQPLPN